MTDAAEIVAALDDATIAKIEGSTILLTGAGGFLGRNLVHVIDELNRRFRPIHLLALDAHCDTRSLKASLAQPQHVDFTNHDLSYKIGITDKCDFVIHAAGKASPHWYRKFPKETINVALKGSRECLEIAKRDGARYLFFSSSEVYQTATQIPTPETYVGAVPSMGSRSAYDVSKLMGETYAHVYHEHDGVNAVVVRIHNSFGTGLRENDHRILPRLASAVKAGRPLKVFASEVEDDPIVGVDAEHARLARLPRRTYCYVSNTILAILLVLLKGKPGEVYNVGVDEPEITVPELVDRVAVLGFDARYKLVAPPEVYATEPMRRCPDIGKIRGLGFSPLVGLDEGLRRFMTWALSPEGSYTGAQP